MTKQREKILKEFKKKYELLKNIIIIIMKKMIPKLMMENMIKLKMNY